MGGNEKGTDGMRDWLAPSPVLDFLDSANDAADFHPFLEPLCESLAMERRRGERTQHTHTPEQKHQLGTV